jgi:hypothetical protein
MAAHLLYCATRSIPLCSQEAAGRLYLPQPPFFDVADHMPKFLAPPSRIPMVEQLPLPRALFPFLSLQLNWQLLSPLMASASPLLSTPAPLLSLFSYKSQTPALLTSAQHHCLSPLLLSSTARSHRRRYCSPTRGRPGRLSSLVTALTSSSVAPLSIFLPDVLLCHRSRGPNNQHPPFSPYPFVTLQQDRRRQTSI